MPKTPINYSNVSIYKIEHIENESLLYVGQTTSFKQRKCSHKSKCSHSKYNSKLYQMIRENGGWEMFRMIEIEKFLVMIDEKQNEEKQKLWKN